MNDQEKMRVEELIEKEQLLKQQQEAVVKAFVVRQDGLQCEND